MGAVVAMAPHALLAAASSPTPAVKTPCTPTASIATSNYPGAALIPTINYLQLPAGKAVEAPGQKILLTGQILDEACVPVSGAVVEIWQNDPYGRWILANAEDLVSVKPVFNGAGRTATDNQGIFHFITLFPAPLSDKRSKTVRAPNFNIKIVAEGVKPFSTVLYFADDRHNENDPIFKKLSMSARQSVSIPVDDGSPDFLNGKFTLVLPAKTPYRGY